MPNWCSNYLTIEHKDPEMIKKLVEGANKGELFSTFFPAPEDEDSYSWANETWGTKWEATMHEDAIIEDNMVNVSFDTAWGPPIVFYNKMKKLGFNIDATYHECGMQFAGHYTNEDGNDCYEYDFDNENWRDDIDDSEVLDMLESEYEYYLEVKAEEEAEAAAEGENDE
jgi:hypothetical protein